MTELTKEDVRDAVREALVEKFDAVFGIDCSKQEHRSDVRKDMEFLRTMRTSTRSAGEKIFITAVGVFGTWVISLLWPSLRDTLK